MKAYGIRHRRHTFNQRAIYIVMSFSIYHLDLGYFSHATSLPHLSALSPRIAWASTLNQRAISWMHPFFMTEFYHICCVVKGRKSQVKNEAARKHHSLCDPCGRSPAVSEMFIVIEISGPLESFCVKKRCNQLLTSTYFFRAKRLDSGGFVVFTTLPIRMDFFQCLQMPYIHILLFIICRKALFRMR